MSPLPVHPRTIVDADPEWRFRLPPRKEKRTQASTMFSTTAKSLTSSSRFSWRPEQSKIFMDWIAAKGPNAMSADLVPLLRALDLDGYEDIENQLGECVHDIIITKVRRKISNTRGLLDEQEREQREKKKEKERRRENEKERELQDQKEREKAQEKYQSYLLMHARAPATGTMNPQLSDPRNSDKKTVIKPEPTDSIASFPSFGHSIHDYMPLSGPFITGCYDHQLVTTDFGQNFSFGPHTTAFGSEYPEYLDPLHRRAPTKEAPKAKTVSSPTSGPSLSSPLPSSGDKVAADSTRPPKSTYPNSSLPQGQNQTQKPTQATPAPSVAANPPPCKASDGIPTDNRLVSCMNKLHKAMADLSLEISRLPKDSESAELETVAHDTGVEVDYLESLIVDYIMASVE
ncbi:hypothetical protein F5B17DRAFT_435212 [Nemania serpens]|nr:hypothetical protein F5B17DRAFT_435212 [Nemania serpens]